MKISCTGLSKKLVMLIGLCMFAFPKAVTAEANSWLNTTTNMYSNVSGNVGIGTTVPSEKLDVNGSLKVVGDYNWNANKNFKLKGAGEWSFDFNDSDGNDYWQVWDPVHNTILAVKNNGNVGIGLSTPQYKFAIKSGSSKVLNINPTNGGVDLYSTGNIAPHYQTDFSIYKGAPGLGSLKFRVDGNGNVGIGNAIPGTKLDILGTSDATGLTNTGLLELGDTLRLDGDEVLTNTNTPLYLQRDNNGDLLVDGSTLAVDASANRVGIGSVSPLFTLDVNGEIRSESVSLSRTDADGAVFFNAYYNAGTKYINADSAFQIVHESATDDLVIKRATVGSANGAATFIDALKINSNGQICIGNCN